MLGLVRDRRRRRLLLHAGLKGAALDQQTLDDAMEQRAVIEPVLDRAQECVDALRRLLRKELDHERAAVGLQLDARALRRGR
jgi:hypothetical protein